PAITRSAFRRMDALSPGYVFLAMNMLKRLLRAVDEFQQQHVWVGFPVAVWKKFGDDEAGNLAALIAYSALVAIFPLLLLLITVLDIVLAGAAIGICIGALGVSNSLQNALNSAWESPFARRPGFPWSWLRSAALIIV